MVRGCGCGRLGVGARFGEAALASKGGGVPVGRWGQGVCVFIFCVCVRMLCVQLCVCVCVCVCMHTLASVRL